jgi:hypothetical protein
LGIGQARQNSPREKRMSRGRNWREELEEDTGMSKDCTELIRIELMQLYNIEELKVGGDGGGGG